MDDLKGKVALVTGASRGLGEGAARELAARGASVMLVARDGAAVAAVAKGIGDRAASESLDVSDYAAVERVVAATRARFGGLDILVNNAGVIEPIAEIATSDPAAWARNIQINLIGAYNVVRAVLPGMLAERGWHHHRHLLRRRLPAAGGLERLLRGQGGAGDADQCHRAGDGGAGHPGLRLLPGTIDTEMQVKIRASGMNVISKIPRGDLLPVAHAVRGLVYLCTAAADDLQGTDASMRDDAFRARIGLG